MAVDYKLIGERIKAARKLTGKTQEQLAEELSVTVGYVSQMERGIAKPNLEMLSEISNSTSCDITYLISGTITHSTDYLSSELSSKINLLSAGDKKMLLEFIDIILKYR